jgi:hypothetical protein
MTILSVSRNPQNKSRFARHRSTWKGTKPHLENVVDALRRQGRRIFIEVQSDFNGILDAVEEAVMGRKRRGNRTDNEGDMLTPHRRDIHGAWTGWERKWKVNYVSPPPFWNLIVEDDLKGDLRLLWEDFRVIAAVRRPDKHTEGTYADYLLVVAISRNNIDIIFSKYGYRKNHHFFHWQAVSEGVNGVHVDDLFLNPGEVENGEPQGFTLVEVNGGV